MLLFTKPKKNRDEKQFHQIAEIELKAALAFYKSSSRMPMYGLLHVTL